MAKYFTLEELTYSATAVRKGIDNTPTENAKKNLIELMEVLDGIREAWTVICKDNNWGTAAIVVNSGYRCNALNKAIGGSKTSAHVIGSAVDFEPKNGRNKEFYDFLDTYLLVNDIMFDQLINEKPVNGIPSWVHLGLKNQKGEQRRTVFTIK